MRILLVADKEEKNLWDYFHKDKVKGVDLIISCGDLDPKYLEFLVTMVNKPLLYVRGNHDGLYDETPPEGCDCLEDEVLTVNGLKIAGLGGSYRYRDGKDMYTEKEMGKRIRKLKKKIRKAGGLDILVTHAPAEGIGDLGDIAHRGFASFNDLISQCHPSCHFYAHVHPEYGTVERLIKIDDTAHVNGSGHYIIDID